jgi:hypothetical protein
LDPDSKKDQHLLGQFSKMMSDVCNENERNRYTMNITDFFMPKILLGETSTAEPIYFSTRETLE